MNIAKDPIRFHQLVAEDAEVERVADGFEFTEGPVWNPPGGYLLFSDIPGDAVFRWEEGAGVSEYRRPSHHSNGLTIDAQGRLLACHHGSHVVTREELDGTVAVIASHYEGKELNSPNDVVVRSDGSIYFTDPPYGRGMESEQQLPFQGVYRIPPGGGDLQLLVDDFARPNGLCFSPDERVLYIDDTERMHIRAFDVAPDGSLGSGRLFFQEEASEELGRGAPDGMKADERGNVYCTGPGGVWVIGPEGDHLGVIRVPENTANLNWGGADWSTLYLTATHAVYRIPMQVRGSRASFTG